MSTSSNSTPAYDSTTRLLHAGHEPRDFHGFVNPAVFRGSTILFPDAASMRGRSQRYTYGLRGTPTIESLEHAIDEMEGSAGTILVPSGLAAVSVPLLAFLSSGDHCLVIDSLYGPTRHFCDTMLKRLGDETEYFDPRSGTEGLRSLMRDRTRVVFLEAPGSNTFEMVDVAALCAVAHERSAVTMMDNTWATPLFFRPLDHGVDLSIHALTKYPGGHSDILMGSVSAGPQHIGPLRKAQMELGINVSPDDAYLVYRGLKTMPVRLQAHQSAALELAQWLETCAEVARVLHPALPSFEGYDLWKRQFTGASGLFSIVLAGGGTPAADAFLNALRIFGLGYSWGGFESLALESHLGDRRHARAPAEGPVIRLQIGLENPGDLRLDIERGLEAASRIQSAAR